METSNYRFRFGMPVNSPRSPFDIFRDCINDHSFKVSNKDVGDVFTRGGLPIDSYDDFLKFIDELRGLPHEVAMMMIDKLEKEVSDKWDIHKKNKPEKLYTYISKAILEDDYDIIPDLKSIYLSDEHITRLLEIINEFRNHTLTEKMNLIVSMKDVFKKID